MKKIFNIGEGFKVPDGTIVHSVLDPRLTSQLGSAWVDEVSVALGEIPAETTSKIHFHPVVVQVTWVLSGHVTVKMKEPSISEPYMLDLSPEQAVITQAGTFFQLINSHQKECRVLYIVTPAFIFECDKQGHVLYNDACVLDQDWDALAKMKWKIPQMQESSLLQKERAQSKERLKALTFLP